jgi:hypothetical protein
MTSGIYPATFRLGAYPIDIIERLAANLQFSVYSCHAAEIL